jgi:L-lactate dehydrogenase (cytochrome)
VASTREWFETVAEAQRRAKRRLPRPVYLALVAGAEAGVTMNDNVRAFTELRFRPHVAEPPAARELATTVMGHDVSFPAAAGERGVSNVLEILRQGISETLLGLGRASVHDLSPEDVIVPAGFTLDHKH